MANGGIEKVAVIGHRGAAGLKPENTLAGWAYAFELGVDLVECDVRLTQDGQPVMIHDATVDRTTNGAGAVAAMTLDEVRDLDAGAGERVPLLAEFLDLLASHQGSALVEVKAPDALEPTVRHVTRMQLGEQVCITGKLPVIRRAKAIDPDLQVGLVGRTHTLEDLEQAAAIGTHGVGFRFRDLTPALVQSCHDLGMVARAWNPVTPEEIDATIKLGVDHITTDRPDIALAHLGRRPA